MVRIMIYTHIHVHLENGIKKLEKSQNIYVTVCFVECPMNVFIITLNIFQSNDIYFHMVEHVHSKHTMCYIFGH